QDNYKLFKALRDDLQERVRLISGYVQQQLQQQPQPPMPPQLVPQVRPVAPVQPPITPSPRQAPSPRAIIPDRWQNLPSIKKLRGDESFTSQNAGERTEEYFKPIFEFILSLYIIPNFNYGSFSNEIKNEINFIEENLRQIRGYMFHDEVHDLKNFALESINYIKNKQNYTPVFGMDRLQRAINSESDLYIRDSLKKLVNNIYEQINKSQQARSPMPPQPVPQPVVPVQPPTRPSVQPPRILRPSEEFARQDKIRKELEEKINEAETILKDNYESIDAKQLTEIIKLKTRLEQFYKTYSDNVISKFTGSGGIDVAIITLKDRALAVKKQIEDKLSELEIRKMTLEEQGLQPQQQARPVRLWRPTTPSPEELRRRAEEARREESAKKTIDETQEMVKVVSSNLENVSKDLEVLNVSDSNLSEKLGRINKYLSDVREWIEQHKDVLSRNVDLSDSQKTALMQWLDNLLLKIKVMQEKADELFARKLQLELALGQQQQYQPPQLRAQLFSFNSYGHRHRHR
ncbi:hypothetical protein K9L05_04360, partial [Candidatus Babeliales bacterium]|nr:hypothetical protein [Candidatus Babeliales bacterium]